MILGHVEVRAGNPVGVEQTASLPVGRRRQSGQAGDRRREIDVAANRRRPRRRLVLPRVPQQKGHVDVLLVDAAPLHVAVVRIAERLTVVARHHDERVVLQPRAPNGVEQPPDMPIGFVQHVQVVIEVVGVGGRLANELDQRNSGRRFIRMMRLLTPGHQEERLRRLLLDELNQLVDGAAILHAPRREQCGARQLVVIEHIAETAPVEERAPVGPVEIARRHERRAIAPIAKHRRQRRTRQPRILLGEVAEIELGICRQQNRSQGIRAAADVRVEIVEDHAARRLRDEAWRRIVWPVIETGPAGRHRLEHDQNHVRRTPGCEQANTAHLRKRTLDQRRMRRLEIREILRPKRAGHPDRAVTRDRLPP